MLLRKVITTRDRYRTPNEKDINNLIAVYWQLAPDDVIKSSVYAQILGNVIGKLWHSEAYFELRSK